VEGRFPFGAPSTSRPPRRPEGSSQAFVLGVYPSALHVRWRLPSWADLLGVGPSVGALAVDVEPTVFWDGDQPSAEQLVANWARRHFQEGDRPDQYGYVAASTNGTSGRHVESEVLAPLGLSLDTVWLTDAVDTFYVKTGTPSRRGQADVLEQVYAPFAREVGLPDAALPARPSPAELVRTALTSQVARLAEEWREAAAPVLITLGEEARQVAGGLADEAQGAPTRQLRANDGSYGRPGRIRIGDRSAHWLAVTHPGNTSRAWRSAREGWRRWATSW
jgi:hypothetical protein